MPVHGIKLDLEFLAIVVGASLVSYFLSNTLVSNVLFTELIAILFFLIGLHLDTDRLRRCFHHKQEIALGWVMIYLLTPLTAFGLAYLLNGAVGDAFIAIGVSAAAIGSPVVWSNLGKGEGDLALVVAGTSLILGFAAIPLLLLGADFSVPVGEIAVKNLLFLGVPLALGVGSQRFENFLFDDLRHHFSKVALWLLILVMGIQFQMLYSAQGLAFFTQAGIGILALIGFVFFSFGLGYFFSKKMGMLERKARTLGFVSGSKGIAIALFIASQISGEAVAFVSIYYFIRQGVCGLIAEYFRHSEVTLTGAFRDPMSFVE